MPPKDYKSKVSMALQDENIDLDEGKIGPSRIITLRDSCIMSFFERV
jgi:hypothetical protein